MFDVVIPVWIVNEELLALTIEAVASLNPRKRLIIVDNGSPVGGGKLRELSDIYIRNKENLGYAKAVNQGLSLSSGFVAVANNDIRVSPNWSETSEEILKNNSVGTIHFRMIPYNDSFSYGDSVWLTGRERWCSGSFFVMDSKYRFDEDYLNSYDDWDLQTRVRKDGRLTAYTNKACYQHRDSSTQSFVEHRNDNDERNWKLFKQKHGEYPERLYERLFPEQMNVPWKPMP